MPLKLVFANAAVLATTEAVAADAVVRTLRLRVDDDRAHGVEALVLPDEVKDLGAAAPITIVVQVGV